MKYLLIILLFLTTKGFSQTIGGYITPNNLPLKGYDTAGQIIGKSGRTYVLKKLNVVSPLALPNDSTIGWTGTQGDLLYFSSSSAISLLPKDANATRYLSNQGTSNNPSWNQVNLANGVTGILPIANGGTGTATPALVAGTNITITGSWPNNTINSSAGGGGGAGDSLYFWNYKNGNVGGHLTADTNIFLGTSQNTNLRFKTWNTQRMLIDSLGNVGIGHGTASYPTSLLHVTGSSVTNSQMRVGSFEVQNAAAVNNLLLTDNAIYNSGFKRRAAGYASWIQLQAGEIQFNVSGTSTAGSAITGIIPFKINTNGSLGLGGTQNVTTPGSFTNMTALIDANGMSIGKAAAAPASNAILDLTSTNRGLLLPRWTESQVGTNTAAGTMGQIAYDSASNTIVAHNGTNYNGRFILVSGTQTLVHGTDYVYTGSGHTWTLPAPSGVLLGRQNGIEIKNRGSGAITLNSHSGNTLYTTAATNTITINAGAACELMPDGTYFNVMFNQ